MDDATNSSSKSEVHLHATSRLPPVYTLNRSYIGRPGLAILYITAFGFAAKVGKVLVQRSLVKIICVACLEYAQTRTLKYQAVELNNRDNNGPTITRNT